MEEEQKVKYQDINRKLGNALNELQKASKYMDSAYNELKKSYTGTEAQKQYAIFQDTMAELKTKINMIKQTILPEVKNKMK